LAVHLPEQQSVMFEKGGEQKTLDDAAASRTTLTAWFELNEKDPEARVHLYNDIPHHYTWHRKGKLWKPRVRSTGGDKVLGRVHGVGPAEQERYYLYLLLLHRRGATSWDDLKTVEGNVLDTFRAAAEAAGLIDTDENFELTLQAAADEKMPEQLRKFFSHLLLTCAVAEPLQLWNRFRDDLSEDFLHRIQNQAAAEELSLKNIQSILEHAGKRLRDFGLPEPQGYSDDMFRTKEVRRETAVYDISEETRKAQEQRAQMYEDQAIHNSHSPPCCTLPSAHPRFCNFRSSSLFACLTLPPCCPHTPIVDQSHLAFQRFLHVTSVILVCGPRFWQCAG
jgi:hypothetical protein